jgi:hypothetical protein
MTASSGQPQGLLLSEMEPDWRAPHNNVEPTRDDLSFGMSIAFYSWCNPTKLCELIRGGPKRSHKTSFVNVLRSGTCSATRQALEAVQIGNDLIAFYPQEMHRP